MDYVTALYQAVEDDIRAYYPGLGSPKCETWDPIRYACASLLEGVTKKQRMVISDRADAEALRIFLEKNEEMGAYKLGPLFEWEAELLGTFKAELYNFFHPSSHPLLMGPRAYLMYGDLGPGANLGTRRTDLYGKLFDATLTVTSMSLYEEYRRYTTTHPTWDDAEQSRYALGHRVCIVDANKLSFVPKREDVSRTICTEPTLNMFYQRGLSHFLEVRLRDYGIDLTNQPEVNKVLAQRGSVDGSLATTDLSSASDSLSLTMLREVLPRSVMSELELLRSPATVLPDGRRVVLNMLSTMGNGYTFSLQTVVFTCVVRAAFRMAGDKPSSRDAPAARRNWGVFGDDIITPSGACTRYTHRLLSMLGFTVNSDKTFIEGPFRESCGGDYLLGVDVRPFFAKEWSTLEALYSLYNQAHRWAERTSINLPKTKRHLASLVKEKLGRRGKPHLVPSWFPDSAGIQVPYHHAVRCLPKDPNGSILAAYRSSKKATLKIREGYLYDARRKTGVNPAGLLLAFVKGGVSGFTASAGFDAEIPIRIKEPFYTTRTTAVPNWDGCYTKGAWLVTGWFPRGWVSPPL